jgi:MATE family multidrug resistance protein
MPYFAAMNNNQLVYLNEAKQNLKLALPIMAGQLGQVLVNFADNIMVGRLGSTALAGISVGNSIFMLFMIVGIGLSFGLPPLIAQADGSKDYSMVGRYFRHSLLINLAFALICIILLEIVIHNIDILGQPANVIVLTKPYLQISAFSLLPFMVFLSLRGLSDGFSKTSYAMAAIIVGNVVNVILNYLLIYGKFGFPALGLEGAAWGSFIARVSMLVTIILLVYKNDALWHFVVSGYKTKLKSNLAKKILSLAIPSSLQMFFEASAFSIAALIMGRVGEKELAAHQISLSLASMTFLIATGLAMSATIRVGNQFGLKSMTGIKLSGRVSIGLVVLFMSLTAIVFMLGRFVLPTIYINDNAVIEYAAYLLIFAAIFQIPDGIQVTAIGILRGMQDVKIPTLITFLAYWVIGLPISYFTALRLGWGAGGVWLGLLLGLSVSAGLLLFRFVTKKVRF